MVLSHPDQYTWPAALFTDEGSKEKGASLAARHSRSTLLGNSWSIPVVMYIFRHFVAPSISRKIPSSVSCIDSTRPLAEIGIADHFLPLPVLRHEDLQNPDVMQACPSVGPVLVDALQSCGFMRHRADQGLPTYGPIGPGWAEKNAQKAAAAVGGVQPRRCTWASGWPSMLPEGLDPATHFLCG